MASIRVSRLRRTRAVMKWGLLALAACSTFSNGLADATFAATESLQPIYWPQRLFFVPYQANTRDPRLGSISKVELLMSLSGSGDWQTLQEAKPNVRGFSYHAPADGEYWFALRHFNLRNQPWPAGTAQPQMRIVVDTQRPEIEVSATREAAGRVVVRYEARDANLDPKSLSIEIRIDNKQWSAVAVGPSDVSQPDRLVGRADCGTQAYGSAIEVRASIADRAGHRAQSTAEVALAGPFLRRPPQVASVPTRERTEPFQPTTQPTAQIRARDWPVTNKLPSANDRAGLFGAPSVAAVVAPPANNPYSARGEPIDSFRTPAQLVAGRQVGRVAAAEDRRPPSIRPTAEARMVNSRTFDIDYDLESVGPWGISKVELWGTYDGGRNWQSFGVDPDNRSPVRVTVPGAGTFGFRILVDGADGIGAAAPQSGEDPELVITVDMQPPIAELTAAELGEGNLAGHLSIRWRATDTNLESRPIGLFYSSAPAGPWSTIATGLENTGEYTWRIGRHVPSRFYLRLEARDTAGNVGAFQTPSPISLARPQPMGRLRSVRPVNSE